MNYKRKRCRRQPAGCSCCGSQRHLGNSADRTKPQHRPSTEPGLGPARARARRPKPFMVMARYVGDQKGWFYQRDRDWSIDARYRTRRAAEQAVEAHGRHLWLRDYEYRIEEAA